MIFFFQSPVQKIFAVEKSQSLSQVEIDKLNWLFGESSLINASEITGSFSGPRVEMVTPWSTNAVEITKNMGIEGVLRIEEFLPATQDAVIDPMLQKLYKQLDQKIFELPLSPEKVVNVKDIKGYNQKEGLALSEEEVNYLENVSKQLGRHLTDSEVFGFSQVNSEHCRHKIFNGTFIIDGKANTFSIDQRNFKKKP